MRRIGLAVVLAFARRATLATEAPPPCQKAANRMRHTHRSGSHS